MLNIANINNMTEKSNTARSKMVLLPMQGYMSTLVSRKGESAVETQPQGGYGRDIRGDLVALGGGSQVSTKQGTARCSGGGDSPPFRQRELYGRRLVPRVFIQKLTNTNTLQL